MIEQLDRYLRPVITNLSSNPYVVAVQNAFNQLFILIMISSLFIFAKFLPLNSNWQELLGLPIIFVQQSSGAILVFLTAQELAKIRNMENTVAPLLALTNFSLTVLIEQKLEFHFFSHWYGADGMISAIIIALSTVQLFWLLEKKKGKVVPPRLEIPAAVTNAFLTVANGLLVLLFWVVLQYLLVSLGQPLHQTLHQWIVKPLFAGVNSYIGVLIVVILVSLTWSIGINASGLIKGFFRPIWFQSQLENLLSTQHNSPAQQIVTEQFFDMIWIGGAGVTLGLIIAIKIFTKSQYLREIGKASFRPAIFNINESVLYGVPIVMHPIMLIPFNIIPIVIASLQYWLMYYGWIIKPAGIAYPWPMPPFISGLVTLVHPQGLLLQGIYVVIAILVYWPFIKIVDRKMANA